MRILNFITEKIKNKTSEKTGLKNEKFKKLFANCKKIPRKKV